MRNMTSNILLSRAAKQIEKRGLAKDTFINDEGETCALGALVVAKYGDDKKVRTRLLDESSDSMDDGYFRNAIVKGAVRKLASTLKITGKSYEDTLIQIAEWSDKPSRRKSDVAKAFRKAITR